MLAVSAVSAEKNPAFRGNKGKARPKALLHVLFGEAILICLPFTRLSHAILIPFTRAYMGSESIGVRRTCDW